MMCRKQQVWFSAPGKSSSIDPSSSIMASLLEALSHVMLRIYNHNGIGMDFYLSTLTMIAAALNVMRHHL